MGRARNGNLIAAPWQGNAEQVYRLLVCFKNWLPKIYYTQHNTPFIFLDRDCQGAAVGLPAWRRGEVVSVKMKRITADLPEELVRELNKEALLEGVAFNWLLVTVVRLGLQLYQGKIQAKITEE